MKRLLIILLLIPHLVFAQEIITELVNIDEEGKVTQSEEGISQLNEELRKLQTDISYSDTRLKIGSFTRDTSLVSGTQEITGIGFTPKLVIFTMVLSAAVQHSSGSDMASTQYGIYTYTGSLFGVSDTYSIAYVGATGNYYGEIASMDSDGFTINWTKESSPAETIEIRYIAFR